jgi:hypothetical protein
MHNKKVIVALSKDEALVFFDWLKRFNESEDYQFDDQAERRVLWDIEANLERNLVEPFEENYSELLSLARSRVRDSE